jgi:hypothetical protein
MEFTLGSPFVEEIEEDAANLTGLQPPITNGTAEELAEVA